LYSCTINALRREASGILALWKYSLKLWKRSPRSFHFGLQTLKTTYEDLFNAENPRTSPQSNSTDTLTSEDTPQLGRGTVDADGAEMVMPEFRHMDSLLSSEISSASESASETEPMSQQPVTPPAFATDGPDAMRATGDDYSVMTPRVCVSKQNDGTEGSTKKKRKQTSAITKHATLPEGGPHDDMEKEKQALEHLLKPFCLEWPDQARALKAKTVTKLERGKPIHVVFLRGKHLLQIMGPSRPRQSAEILTRLCNLGFEKEALEKIKTTLP
jgi:hypothetical protein